MITDDSRFLAREIISASWKLEERVEDTWNKCRRRAELNLGALFNGGQSARENGDRVISQSVDFRGARGCFESPRNPTRASRSLYFQPGLFSFLKHQSLVLRPGCVNIISIRRGEVHRSSAWRMASTTTATFRKMFIPLTFIPAAYFRPISGVTFSFSSVAQTVRRDRCYSNQPLERVFQHECLERNRLEVIR